ncbi:sensor histidine kinase [Seleniivibrio sp.]|uniref:ATP-binding protein n=1 Tax=Seleniivibrio sp. TaxID=2898801 RepID=UPI0025FC6893|nr:sensor histidine kinase [Seleniivibrio sp.]MCD8553462.1 sensor histidine kinase [Seleniivibrio sp.]
MKKKFYSLPIRMQMLIMISFVVLLQLFFSGILFSGMVADFLKIQIGDKALRIAETIASLPEVQEAAAGSDRSGGMQELAESIRKSTDARYIVIADINGMRLSHPNPENIGKKFSGLDYYDALLKGKSYVSESVGTLGPSIRGITPIFSHGKTVGFVAVGYLKSNVQATIFEHQKKPLVFVFMMLVTGLTAAVLIANYQKKVTLGLEPTEIADLFIERTAVIESVRPGVIAVNADKKIRLINKSAVRALNISGDVTDRDLNEIFPSEQVDRVLFSGGNTEDSEIFINGVSVLCNIMPVMYMDIIQGAVITFRRKDELEVLSQELNRVKSLSDMLRVQSHEYSNKLHTISGLIQLGAYQEAQEIILAETAEYQDMMSAVNTAIPDPVVSAVVMGKYNRARELKIDFVISKESSMADIPPRIDRKKIVTILGNLLDNAFDAVQEAPEKRVVMSMQDTGSSLIFTVEDSGTGMGGGLPEDIFNKGVSTKGEGRGIGLYLVSRALTELKGSVGMSKSELGGVKFRISIPKEV